MKPKKPKCKHLHPSGRLMFGRCGSCGKMVDETKTKRKPKRKPSDKVSVDWSKVWADFFSWNKGRRASSTGSLERQMNKIEELVNKQLRSSIRAAMKAEEGK